MKPSSSSSLLTWTPRHRVAWVLSLLGTLGIGFVLIFIFQLRTPETPGGIIAYEFAFTAEHAAEMVRAWETRGLVRTAWASLLTDYGFLIAYGCVMALSTVRVGPALLQTQSSLKIWATLPLIAAGLDAIENASLMVPLTGSTHPLFPALAALCAAIKFAIIFISLTFLAVAAIKTWLNRKA